MSIFDVFDKIKKDESHGTGKPEYIIAGLGNVGPKYDNTRHNAGFMAVDALAEKYNFEVKRMRFKALTGEAVISGKKCLIMKPVTFMNNSGESVSEAMNFYKIPPENVFICFDDISLQPSKLRIRRKGSHGGHNGMRSIIDLTGSEDFPRIKLGVGNKPTKDYDLASWVLSSFTDDEKALMKISAENAAIAVTLMVDGKTDEAMNKFNS